MRNENTSFSASCPILVHSGVVSVRCGVVPVRVLEYDTSTSSAVRDLTKDTVFYFEITRKTIECYRMISGFPGSKIYSCTEFKSSLK